jgi:hypothetical protein
MFYLYENNKKDLKYKQEYVYIDYYSLSDSQIENNKEQDESFRGVVDIDLNNGKTIKI